MKRPFMVYIGFTSICCSKVAKEGKSCPRLLVLQRVAQNAESCLKVAEHNLFMPTGGTTKFDKNFITGASKKSLGLRNWK